MIEEVEILKWNNYKVVPRLVWQQGVFSYDSPNVYNLFIKVCGKIVQGHVPPSVSCFFFCISIHSIGEIV
jgi:hypothetical protein